MILRAACCVEYIQTQRSARRMRALLAITKVVSSGSLGPLWLSGLRYESQVSVEQSVQVRIL